MSPGTKVTEIAAGKKINVEYYIQAPQPSAEATEAANALKTQVLNGMLANLPEEAVVHRNDIRAEAVVSGCPVQIQTEDEEALEMLANHYAEQRRRSVRTQVPMHFWVRPAHLKAMAIYAREPIYVLDVAESGLTRIQAYAYEDTVLPNGDTYETGSVEALPTEMAMQMLQELISNGILPTVLVLRWLETGNHFQAVTYGSDRYGTYVESIMSLAQLRNDIRLKYGGNRLDEVPYDATATTKAAKQALKSIRKAARGCQTRKAQEQSDNVTEKQGDSQKKLKEQGKSIKEHLQKEATRAASTTEDEMQELVEQTRDRGCNIAIMDLDRCEDTKADKVESQEAEQTDNKELNRE